MLIPNFIIEFILNKIYIIKNYISTILMFIALYFLDEFIHFKLFSIILSFTLLDFFNIFYKYFSKVLY